MISNKQLVSLIKAHRTGKSEVFTSLVRELVATARKEGNDEEAEELERALNPIQNSKMSKQLTKVDKSISLQGPRSIPLSKGDQFPLVEVRFPLLSFDDIVLIPSTREKLENIINEQNYKTKFANYGLTPENKILFYGPPGCGKTLASDIIANKLNCPLIYVRFDSVISSYLGETSSNLKRVFDFATNGLSVLFFDEFDAIGKSRDSQEEVGELKRVVNSFLQMMDNFAGKGIVIAATNHEKLLDVALWRRFDEVVYFGMPEFTEIIQLLELKLGGVKLRDFSYQDAAQIFSGLSYSDITKICLRAIKQMILEGSSQLNFRTLKNTYSGFIENRPKLL